MENNSNQKTGDGPLETHPLLQPGPGGPPGVYPPLPPVQGVYPPPPGTDLPPEGVHPPPQQGIYPSRPAPVVTNQPVAQGTIIPPTDWMAKPYGATNCPPGLEYLTMIDQLLVHQKVELLEAFTGFETKNKYTVKNSLGQKVFYAGEESDCCTRNCCGPLRPFDMKIIDNFGNQIMNLHRPLACDSCCCPCCLQSMEVTAPPGTIIGVVEQQWSILFPKFAIKDPTGEVILRIEGPFCTSSCCCQDVEFKVLTADGKNQVGKISKQWSGLGKEMFTDADNFGITFPMELDVRMKATMLGACFLIDMMFFEGNSDDPGML